ncbi:MAG TPA: EAL domain-containing protein [Mycobacteriales bacterium]|nr:EAL domain-containing protein [Mycobacteriales bacterium]
MLDRPRRAGAAMALALLLAAALHAPPLRGAAWQPHAANLLQLAGAATAAASALARSRTCTGRRRRAWLAVAAGCAGWAAGQALWTGYEAAGRAVPFPSAADAGYLVLPLALGLACLLHAPVDRRLQGRWLLDALTVAAALGLVSWSTVLRHLVDAGATDPLAFVVSLAYPAADLVVLVLVALALAHRRTDRAALGLLGAGALCIAVADGAFAVLAATGAFASGQGVDLLWLAGFGLLALAAVVADPGAADDAADPPLQAQSAVPYVAVVVAMVVMLARNLSGTTPEAPARALLALVVVLVLVRQFLHLRETRVLLGALAGREAELRHQAFHDGLTGLANRALFGDRLQHALDLHRRDLRPLAVLLCDLDDFKVVNDTAGHAAGDALLVRVAERLRGAVRSADTLARLGGDEFAVLLEQGEDAATVARRVAEALDAPFAVADRTVRVTASIGLAEVPPDAATPTPSELLVRADTAMYRAKRQGKSQVQLYRPGMSLEEVEQERLAQALAAALDGAGDDNRLEVHYQPVVTVATGVVEGLECLARWTWEGRRVPPSEFVPVAERTGLVARLTDHVLELACADLARWTRELGAADLRVGVNVSPPDLVSPGLPGRVRAALERHGVEADRLVLEVTETGLLPDPPAARAATRALADLGVRLALDDFGVGYSSLAHLSAVPLRVLKVDRAFVAGLGEDPQQERFVRALLALGADLGLSVVAEGVERQEQLRVLRDLGCEMAQGFLLSRPVPAAEVPALLAGPVTAAVVPLPR